MSSPEQPSMEQTISLTFLTLGSSTVGKSSLITRYAKNIFRESSYSTVGIDYQTKTFSMFDRTIVLKIYDTAGQERFRGLARAYYKNADGILLMYNIADRGSYNDVENWRKEIKENASKKAILLLIGNKCDLEEKRETSKEEAEKLAKEYEMDYFETSAKTGYNVNEAIEHLVETVLKKKELITAIIKKKKEEKEEAIRIEEMNQKKKKNNCC